MNDDAWKEAEKFQERADDAHDLFSGIPSAYPIKRNLAALRARREAGDPNVIEVHDGDYGVRYHLKCLQMNSEMSWKRCS